MQTYGVKVSWVVLKCQAYVASVIGVFTLLGNSSLLYAQVHGGHVFGSRSSCEASHVVPVEQCKFAFANAAAELDEKAPRFSKRQDCERPFKRCMIAGFGQSAKGVEYMPNMRGVEITLRSESDHSARPVLEAETHGLDLRPRTILRADAGISLSQRAQAQKNWAAAQAAKLAPAPNMNPDSKEPQYDLAPRQAAKPPAPTVKLQPDLAVEAQRRRLKRLKESQIIQIPD